MVFFFIKKKMIMMTETETVSREEAGNKILAQSIAAASDVKSETETDFS